MRDYQKLYENIKAFHKLKPWEIMKDTELCQHWMNQYPVLFLSFKDVDGTSFENALALLQFTLSQCCDVDAYLEDGEQVTEVQ